MSVAVAVVVAVEVEVAVAEAEAAGPVDPVVPGTVQVLVRASTLGSLATAGMVTAVAPTAGMVPVGLVAAAVTAVMVAV